MPGASSFRERNGRLPVLDDWIDRYGELRVPGIAVSREVENRRPDLPAQTYD